MAYTAGRTLEENRAIAREQKRRQRERNGPEVTRAKWREWYANNREHRLEYEKNDVRRQETSPLRWALESGAMAKPEACENCGEIREVQAHHNDYDKPLEVQWLCTNCHSMLHMIARAL